MSSPDASANPRDALETLLDYYSAFSTLDVRAVLPYFNEPCLLVSPQGALSAPTSAALAAVVAPVMEGLRAREFGRSSLTASKVTPLSATASLVAGVAMRYKRDGQELERVGVTYILHKTGEAWKIAVIVLHDPLAA